MRRPTLAASPGRATLLTTALLAAVLLAAACPPLHTAVAQPSPDAVQAASAEDGFFLAPDIAVDRQGNAVLVWYGETAGQAVPDVEVYARRYGPDGAPLGPAFHVNATAAGNQRRPAVAVDPTGAFVVVWDTNTSTVWARRFAPDGAPLTGDIRVSPQDSLPHRDPDVAVAADGTFLVAWQLTSSGGDDDVVVRRFNRDGTPLSPARIPYDPAAETALQMNPALAALPTGTALVWEELAAAALAPGSSPDVLRRLDAAGTTAIVLQRLDTTAAPAGPPQTVAASDAEELRDPAIAAGADGGAVVAWATFTPTAGGIAARGYGADGAPLAPATPITPPEAAERFLPAAAATPSGTTVVAWIDATAVDNAPTGLAVRPLTPAGAPSDAPRYPRPPALGPSIPSGVAAAISPTAGNTLWLAWAQTPPGANPALSAIYLLRRAEQRLTVALPLIRN